MERATGNSDIRLQVTVNLRDRRRQSSLAVVDVADGADVKMGLSSVIRRKRTVCGRRLQREQDGGHSSSGDEQTRRGPRREVKRRTDVRCSSARPPKRGARCLRRACSILRPIPEQAVGTDFVVLFCNDLK